MGRDKNKVNVPKKVAPHDQDKENDRPAAVVGNLLNFQLPQQRNVSISKKECKKTENSKANDLDANRPPLQEKAVATNGSVPSTLNISSKAFLKP